MSSMVHILRKISSKQNGQCIAAILFATTIIYIYTQLSCKLIDSNDTNCQTMTIAKHVFFFLIYIYIDR